MIDTIVTTWMFDRFYEDEREMNAVAAECYMAWTLGRRFGSDGASPESLPAGTTFRVRS